MFLLIMKVSGLSAVRLELKRNICRVYVEKPETNVNSVEQFNGPNFTVNVLYLCIQSNIFCM
jgi:hypothetical protein